MSDSLAVVVGSGAVGLTAAIALREAGLAVVVIDGQKIASGSSKGALGSLTPYSDHCAAEATRELARRSVELFPPLIQKISDSTGLRVDFEETGTLELAVTESERIELRSTFERLSESGCPVHWLEPNDALTVEPNINPATKAGILYDGEALVDIEHLLRGLNEYSVRIGCVTRSGLAVNSVRGEASHVSIATSQGRIDADFVVIAAGLGYGRIVGLPPIPIFPVRGEVIEALGPPGFFRKSLYCGHGFIAPRADGRVLLGSNYDAHTDEMDSDISTIRIGAASRSIQANMRIAPSIDDFQLRRVWKDWRPRTPDDQPAIGRTENPRILVAAGFFGLGITLAPATAELISNLVQGKPSTAARAHDPMRFRQDV